MAHVTVRESHGTPSAHPGDGDRDRAPAVLVVRSNDPTATLLDGLRHIRDVHPGRRGRLLLDPRASYHGVRQTEALMPERWMSKALSVALGWVFCSLLTPANAGPTELWWSGPDELSLHARFEVGGPGLPAGRCGDALVGWWMRGAERRWNAAATARLAGHDAPVRLRVRLEWRRYAADAPPDREWHRIEVVDAVADLRERRAGRPTRLFDGYRSWAYLGGRPGDVAACFARQIWPTVVAHELGHVFGLKDEYDTTQPNAQRFLRGLTRCRPSLMEVSWAPWARLRAEHVAGIHAAATEHGWWRAGEERR